MDFWVLILCFHIQYYRNIHEHVPGTHVLVSLGVELLNVCATAQKCVCSCTARDEDPLSPGGPVGSEFLGLGNRLDPLAQNPPPQNVIFYKYYTFKTGSGAVGPSYSKCTLWASNTLYRNLIKSLGQALLDLVNQNLHFNKAPGDSYSQSMRRTSLEHTEVG